MHPLAEQIQQRFPDGFLFEKEWRGDIAVTVKRDALHDVCRFLREDPAMDFDYIVHVSSVDWPDEEERFEVVYEVYSIRKRQRIRIKARVPEHDCYVDSMTDVWKGADFMEREVFDMMGIRFNGIIRIFAESLMPDDYPEGISACAKTFPFKARGGEKLLIS